MGVTRYSYESDTTCDNCGKLGAIRAEVNGPPGHVCLVPEGWFHNHGMNLTGCSEPCWIIVREAAKQKIDEAKERVGPRIEKVLGSIFGLDDPKEKAKA